jgi:nanoRNase/pAp phosphatase (c-di-AMP/oligoRNAs hydrolase)
MQNAISIERFFQQQLEQLKSLAKVISYKGFRCAVVNSNYVFTSELCHTLIKELGTEIALSYYIKEDNVVNVSLRSNGKVDVSAIAKQYPGGGGHNDAAGFVMNLHALLSTVLYVPVIQPTKGTS